ncbi:MAG: hypothetical protein WBZ36_17600 [Candidatus Nitrosopolaris sp.]
MSKFCVISKEAKKANPLTVILKELEKFEKFYYIILEKTADACNKQRTNAMSTLEQDLEDPPYGELLSALSLMWQPFHIFVEFLKTYLTRLITVWSKVIQDKDVISKLNSMIFAKFAHIQTRSYKIMASKMSEEMISGTIRSSYAVVQSNTTQQLKERIQSLKILNPQTRTG